MPPECLCPPSLSLPSPSRFFVKDSYSRIAGLRTTTKGVAFKKPYLPTIAMPPSSIVLGSDPDPPTTTATNPTQCDEKNCINHAGCFVDLTGGVRAVPTTALKVTPPSKTAANSKWTPLLCAAEAKNNYGTVFAIQVGAWACEKKKKKKKIDLPGGRQP